MRSSTTIAVAGIAALSAFCLAIQPSPAPAQGAAAIGQLVCTSAGRTGMVVMSEQSFACTFRTTGGRTQRYTASQATFGIDIGQTGKTTLVWGVFAPTSTIRQGMLAGTYAGVGADASLSVGGGANVLVGGSGNTISLQPLSGQTQSGVNIAAGIRSLTLRAR